MHSVPKGSETHFKVVVVSAAFEGLGLVDRHRRVNQILEDELKQGVHALSIRALTPAQWAESGAGEFASPPCLGGSKAG
jgi:BolA protein